MTIIQVHYKSAAIWFYEACGYSCCVSIKQITVLLFDVSIFATTKTYMYGQRKWTVMQHLNISDNIFH